MMFPNFYGNQEVDRITVEKLLSDMGLTDRELEIFILRFGLGWYYEEIGQYIGEKYRNKAFSEGTIRYQVKGIQSKIEDYLTKKGIKNPKNV